jgi:hypothetical protein
MINSGGRYPGDDTMTVLADVGRLNVRKVLAGRIGTVVTARTITSDIDMVKIRRGPGSGYVTVITGVAAGDVCGCLAGCRIAVVTGAASTNYLDVVDSYCWRPKIHAVAVLTNKGCLNVRDRLASRVGAVMAVRAAARNAGMIKISR